MKNPPDGWPRIAPAVFYNDAAAAIDWFTRAFGFAVRERIENDAGQIVHSQLVLDGGLIMVGQVGLHPDRTYLARDNQGENAATIKMRMPRRLAAL